MLYNYPEDILCNNKIATIFTIVKYTKKTKNQKQNVFKI